MPPSLAQDALASGRRRARLSLDGDWDFSFKGPTAGLSGEGHRVRSPGIWQTQFPALRNMQGTGRYRRRVEIPHDWKGRSVVLVMEGVFHESVILVDDVPVAIRVAHRHTGAGEHSRDVVDPGWRPVIVTGVQANTVR